jgi:hypothetical protein
MKKRLFEIAGAAYVIFAILVAHTALAPTEAPRVASSHQATVMEVPDGILFHSQRMDNTDEREDRANYTVRVWTASWCGPCTRYKAEEVPSLVKLGYTVEVLDIDKEEKPAYVQRVPTVELLYEGKTLIHKPYWRAEDIEDFVIALNPTE